MKNWLVKLFTGGATEQIGEYFRERQKLKQELKVTKLKGEIAIAQARASAKAAQQAHVHSWEQTFVNMQRESKKDEVVLGILAGPYVGAFIPGVQDHVLVGFQHLEQMPYWAVGLTVAVFLAIYGIRHRNANRLAAPGLRDRDVREVSDGSKTSAN